MDGEEWTNEEVNELFGSPVCDYRYTAFNHTHACGHGGCGDHPEYVIFNDDPGDHHDHPGAAGIFHLSLASADYHAMWWLV